MDFSFEKVRRSFFGRVGFWGTFGWSHLAGHTLIQRLKVRWRTIKAFSHNGVAGKTTLFEKTNWPNS